MIDPPYLRRAASKDKGRAGKKHEASLAKRMGGQLTPGSGAIEGAKGDLNIKHADVLMEGKTSTRESYTIKREDLHKIRREAVAMGKTPAFSLCFVNAEGESKKGDRWVMITEEVFQELIENQK